MILCREDDFGAHGRRFGERSTRFVAGRHEVSVGEDHDGVSPAQQNGMLTLSFKIRPQYRVSRTFSGRKEALQAIVSQGPNQRLLATAISWPFSRLVFGRSSGAGRTACEPGRSA